MRPLVVWSGWTTTDPAYPGYVQLQFVVAARSGAEVMRAAGVTRSHLNDYCSETGNEDDIAQAMSEPGVVFVRPLDSRDPADWRRAERQG